MSHESWSWQQEIDEKYDRNTRIYYKKSFFVKASLSTNSEMKYEIFHLIKMFSFVYISDTTPFRLLFLRSHILTYSIDCYFC